MLPLERKKSLRRQERKVLRMACIEYIKDLYENEGLSLREIARQTKKDFRTVQKYAYQSNWNNKERPVRAREFPTMSAYINPPTKSCKKSENNGVKPAFISLTDTYF